MAIDGVLAVAIAVASFNILLSTSFSSCVCIFDLTWSDLVCLLRFSADAAADVAQLATAAGLLRQLCVSV